MKLYEFIPIEEKNKWINWLNTYISFTNSRIESLKEYKEFFARDYKIFSEFVAVDTLKGGYTKLLDYESILKNAIDLRLIMKKDGSTNYDYEQSEDKTRYIKQKNGSYRKYIFHKMLVTNNSEAATHYYDRINNKYMPYDRSNPSNKAENLYIKSNSELGSPILAINKEGLKTPNYDDSLPLYKRKGDHFTLDTGKTAENENENSLVRYHILFRSWFKVDNVSGVKKLYFDNAVLKYKEGFLNSYDFPFHLTLGENQILSPLFTIINTKMIGYGEKLTFDDFTLRVQNPLSGYRASGNSNGELTFTYSKDLSNNTDVEFDFSIGSHRFVKADEISNDSTYDFRDVIVSFIRPGISCEGATSKWTNNGLMLSEGFMPILLNETVSNSETTVEEVFEPELVCTPVAREYVDMKYTTKIKKECLPVNYTGL